MKKIVTLGLAMLFALLPVAVAHGKTRTELTTEQAREEVDIIAQRIAQSHPNPFWQVSEAQWQKRLHELRARTGPIDHVTQYFDLFSLMALSYDTHTQIYPEADTPGFSTSYPIRFRRFEEGVVVAAADGRYRDWVGSRVISIAGQDMDNVVEALTAYAASDHILRKRSWAVEMLLPQPATYAYNRWMRADGTVPLVIETPTGKRRKVALKETSNESFDAFLRSGTASGYYWPKGWRTLNDIRTVTPPLSRRHLDRNYMYTDIDGTDAVYVQINRPSNEEGREGLFQFTLDLFNHVENHSPAIKRLIIDVRYDLGGSISYTLPFAYISQALSLCCEPGSIVVLAGRETVSAGSIMVGAFERAARPVVIGEPTGSAPNIFYRHEQIPLPHSGLFAEASTGRYVSTVTEDHRVYSAPDILIPERAADIINGRDPALEAALALTKDVAETFYTRGRAYQAWIRPSQDNVPRGRFSREKAQ